MPSWAVWKSPWVGLCLLNFSVIPVPWWGITSLWALVLWKHHALALTSLIASCPRSMVSVCPWRRLLCRDGWAMRCLQHPGTTCSQSAAATKAGFDFISVVPQEGQWRACSEQEWPDIPPLTWPRPGKCSDSEGWEVLCGDKEISQAAEKETVFWKELLSIKFRFKNKTKQ